MPLRIEDYALLGDTESAALIGRDGSVDWLCWPRFDSDACFAALLGGPDQGRWRVAPQGGIKSAKRRYREASWVLETELTTQDGTAAVVDFMPVHDGRSDLVRRIEGRGGRIPFTQELIPRFGYGLRAPWIRRMDGGISAKAGPDALLLRGDVASQTENGRIHAEFAVEAGQSLTFVLSWHPSHRPPPPPFDVDAALRDTDDFWRGWSSRCRYQGPWKEAVVRSLLTLKALTYSPTGGLVAAATTSLPERLGGVRNWDYRYCWLRDATLTLTALLDAGYLEEARAWREWLLRAVAGEPRELQIMYGVAGERRLTEIALEGLPGYEGSRPVRIGNASSLQRQLDIYGEVLDCLHQANRAGIAIEEEAWLMQRQMLEWLEGHWNEPDEGIWEMRGPRRHFTHSKMMAWVAVDRAVRSAERLSLPGPVETWRALRSRIHEEVCERGYDARREVFTQSFGSPELDASLLMMPLVGFLPVEDSRVVRTIEAIQRELCEGGLVHRYDTRRNTDHLPPGEGVFLACSFWLADCLALLRRDEESRRLFERLLSIRNDVGLLSEQYLPDEERQCGNFPQAFSHLALIGTAQSLTREEGPARRRQ